MNPGTDRRGPLLIHVWAVLDRLLADGLWHPETDVIDTVALTTGAAHRTVENQLRSGSAKGWVNRKKRPTGRYVKIGPKHPPDRFPTGTPPVPEGVANGTGSRFPLPWREPDPRDRSRTGSRPTGMTTLHTALLEAWDDLTRQHCPTPPPRPGDLPAGGLARGGEVRGWGRTPLGWVTGLFPAYIRSLPSVFPRGGRHA